MYIHPSITLFHSLIHIMDIWFLFSNIIDLFFFFLFSQIAKHIVVGAFMPITYIHQLHLHCVSFTHSHRGYFFLFLFSNIIDHVQQTIIIYKYNYTKHVDRKCITISTYLTPPTPSQSQRFLYIQAVISSKNTILAHIYIYIYTTL